MRALTLTQPWAGLVVSGIKLVENRKQPVIRNASLVAGPIRIAIHASKEIDESVYDIIEQIASWLVPVPGHPSCGAPQWYRMSRITSAIIGAVTVYGARYIGGCSREFIDEECARLGMPDQARWMFGPTCYLLRDAMALETPVPCRGWQGCWTVKPPIAAAVLEANGSPWLGAV